VLEQSLKAGQDRKLDVVGALFLALAHQKRDPKAPDALTWRRKGEKAWKEVPPGDWTWQERIELNVLRREVAQAVPEAP